jgi:hypothetical protein
MQLQAVMLYLQHDFYNIIFKMQHKLYIASGLVPPPPPMKNSGCAPGEMCPHVTLTSAVLTSKHILYVWNWPVSGYLHRENFTTLQKHKIYVNVVYIPGN